MQRTEKVLVYPGRAVECGRDDLVPKQGQADAPLWCERIICRVWDRFFVRS